MSSSVLPYPAMRYCWVELGRETLGLRLQLSVKRYHTPLCLVFVDAMHESLGGFCTLLLSHLQLNLVSPRLGRGWMVLNLQE